MKKGMLKKTCYLMLVLIFIFMSVINVVIPDTAIAAPSDFVLTHGYTGTLTKGAVFNLPIMIRNLTDDTIDDIQLDFSASSIVSLDGGGTIVPITGFSVTKAEGDKSLITINNMKFIGDGSNGMLSIRVIYEKNNVLQDAVIANLYLNTEKESAPLPTPDPSKYKPDLTATMENGTTVSAGLETFVKLNIKNLSSSYNAKNIVVTPVYDEDSPFNLTTILSENPIPELKFGETKEVRLNINADRYADAGVYPLTFKVSYLYSLNYDASSEHTVYIKVENSNTNTRLYLESASEAPVQAVAGKSFTLPLNLRNSGAFYAKDISVTVTNLSQEGFTLSSGASKLLFTKVDARGFTNFSLNLIAASGMKTGSYPVNFKLDYSNEKGDKLTEEQQLWIPVTGSGDEVSRIEVIEIKPSLSNVKSSEMFDVSVKFKNNGTVKIDQLKVSADGTTALLPVTQNLYIVSNVEPGETKALSFKFQASPDAARGSVPITIKIDNLDGQNTSISQAISVFIDAEGGGKDEPGKNAPKIIVKSYSMDPALVKAGEKFQLHIEFLNTHSSKTVQNIKGNFIVTESSNETGNVFTPVDCSNTFYIDKINPQNTYDWDLTLFTIPDAKSKTYNVTISFEYEDDHGGTHKAEEIIGIPVYQPSRFETSEISLPPQTFMGQPLYLAFEMYNMGKTEIYNVRMSVEGDFEAQPKSSYFGNFESGRREYCEINLIPMKPGKSEGKIVVAFESASGEIQTFEKEFSMDVMDMPQMDPGFPVDGPMKPGMPGMIEEEKKEGGFIGSIWFYGIIGVVVIVGTVITVKIVKKRKKDKEFEF